MEALPFGTQTYSGHLCTVPDRDVRVVGYHARPDNPPVGGLVIATDIGGVRPLFTDMCDRLASHGISVVAVEPFDRIPEVKEKAPGDRLLDVARLQDAEQIGDLVAAAEELRRWDGVAKVGILGFCMGGMYALKAAATGSFDVAIACYGMLRLPEDWRGAGRGDALDTAADVCLTIAIMGDQDPWIPADQIDELRAAWAGRPDCEVVVIPGADHGFIHDPERPTHRPVDAAAAWGRILAAVR
jgi:carboxymethylenebutenolidase